MNLNPAQAMRYYATYLISAFFLVGVVVFIVALKLYPPTDSYTFKYQYQQAANGEMLVVNKESCVRFDPNKSNLDEVKGYFISLHPVDSGVLSVSDGCPKTTLFGSGLNELYL